MMKKSDFKQFKPVYIESCETMRKQDGSCLGIKCERCPFYEIEYDCEDNTNFNKAEQYLALYKEEKMKDLSVKEMLELFGNWKDHKRLDAILMFKDGTGQILNSDDDEKERFQKITELIKILETKPFPEKMLTVNGKEYSEATLQKMIEQYVEK